MASVSFIPYFPAARVLGLQPSMRRNVTFRHYTAGHMFHIDVPSHRKRKGDITQFFGDALKEGWR